MSPSKARILVLDDEKLIRWSLGQVLTQTGFEVDVVATAEEALRQAEAVRYQVVLADLEVCGEGVESFFERMMAGQSETALVIITAMPPDKARERLGGCPAFRIVEKPFASEAIRAVVIEALRSPKIPLETSKEV